MPISRAKPPAKQWVLESGDASETLIELPPRYVRGGKSKTLKFGSVKVRSPVPDKQTVQLNIDSGRNALVRAKKAFTSVGVNLRHGKGIPVYHVDAEDPSVMIRKLDGKVERGRLIDGKFVVLDE